MVPIRNLTTKCGSHQAFRMIVQLDAGINCPSEPGSPFFTPAVEIVYGNKYGMCLGFC